MNLCKNCPENLNKKYKGTEPSPKGLGYCAGCIKKEGTIMKGKDGNEWITVKRSSGEMFWKKNNTHKTSKKIDKSGKKYYIHDNGNRPFEVVIKDSNVSIYCIKDDENNDYENKKDKYDKLVRNYKPEKIYIGKSIGGNVIGYLGADHYGKDDKKFIGNTILLHIKDNEYIYIGPEIYKFNMHKDDAFVKYYSQVGNSDVPYPVLLGKKYVYFLGEQKYISREYFDKLDQYKKIINYADAYGTFYGHNKIYKNKGGLMDKGMKLIGYKLIKERDW